MGFGLYETTTCLWQTYFQITPTYKSIALLERVKKKINEATRDVGEKVRENATGFP